MATEEEEAAADSPEVQFDSDWDRPFTDQELQAIDTAFQSATPSSSSSSSRFCIPSCEADDDEGRNTETRRRTRRRLPDSIAGGRSLDKTPLLTSSSFSLSPCVRNQYHSPYRSSFQAKLTMRFPPMKFGGHIMYGRTVAEVDKAANELLKIVEAKKREVGRVILGFDIEWRPTFRRGVPPGKAAVMQICADPSHCYVMHIIHSGIPQSLQSLLEDPTSVKVGVGIGNDAVKVFKDHNVSVKALGDLSSIANQKLDGDPKNWSLGALTEMLICKQLPKPGKIRLGNWETDFLSKEQLQYAATDAFASWYIYEVLNTLPNAADKSNEEAGVLRPE